MNHPRHSTGENTPADTVEQILSSPEFFLCKTFNCRMSHEACTMRIRVARQQDEDGKDVTFSKCLDCEAKEVPVEKVCMVEGCGKKITARGRCSTHYAQYRSEIQKRGRVPVVGTTKPLVPEKDLFRVKPEVLSERQKILDARAKKGAHPVSPKIPTTKRVNVQFTGPDVALWEQLKARAKKNRRDLRTEALFIIEQALTVPEEPEVYR
jgi:hypothetical protein